MEPVISVIESNDTRTRYRIEGGEIAGGWKVREGRQAWCEFTIYNDGNALASFGGEVWPGAWPDIFDVGPRSVHGQTTTLTEKGRKLVQLAKK
jgi:hypothetical protein